MKTLETILPTLHNLFIEQLPLYIEKINKEKNDGLILLPFQNKSLFENCQKLPCFKITLKETDYSEKDRIVENTVFNICIEINNNNSEKKWLLNFCRYAEAICNTIQEYENNENILEIKIKKIQENKVYIRIVME